MRGGPLRVAATAAAVFLLVALASGAAVPGSLSPGDAKARTDNPYRGSPLAFADSGALSQALARADGEVQRAVLISGCVDARDRAKNAQFCAAHKPQVELLAKSLPTAPLPEREEPPVAPKSRGQTKLAPLTAEERRANQAAAVRQLGDKIPRAVVEPVSMLEAGAATGNPVAKSRWGKVIKYAFWQVSYVSLPINEPVNMSFSQAAAKYGTVPRGADAAWPWFDDTRQISSDVFIKLEPVTMELVARFRAAVRHIEEHTCLRFEEVAADEDTEKIMVARNPISMDNASVGQGKNLLTFLPHGSKAGIHFLKLSDSAIFGVGIVVHEILHALGVGHTMMRKDTPRYVHVDVQAIPPKIYELQFTPRPGDEDLLAYDYGSVMSYGVFDGSRRRMTVLMPKSQPGEDPVAGPSAIRRSMNEDAKNGGFGHVLVSLGDQGRLSAADAEGVNRAYECRGHLRSKPPSAALHPHLAGAASVCSCPSAQYRARADAGQDCIPGDEALAESVARAVYELPAAGVKKGSRLAALTRAGGATDEAKSVAAIVRALNPKDRGTADFLASCRLYCEVQQDYAAAGCWINARRFPEPLKVTEADRKRPLKWRFDCNNLAPFVTVFGCLVV